MKTPDDVAAFLAETEIAVAGVSRAGDTAANIIYRTMKERGYHVYAVNPSATEVEGDPCYPNLESIPINVGGVVVATPPSATGDVLHEAAMLGIKRAWVHRSLFGEGSYSESALEMIAQHDIHVIGTGCPMMFMKPVDPAHTCMRWLGQATGRVPAEE